MQKYEEKFTEFLRMLKNARGEELSTVVVHHPQVLGDNYDELVESLNRLSDAELSLSIVPRNDRKGNQGRQTPPKASPTNQERNIDESTIRTATAIIRAAVDCCHGLTPKEMAASAMLAGVTLGSQALSEKELRAGIEAMLIATKPLREAREAILDATGPLREGS